MPAAPDRRLMILELIARLHGPQVEDALFALRTLPEALPVVTAAYLGERDPEVREMLIHCLWQYRDHAALPTLDSALRDPDDRVWKEALDGLVALGGEDAVRVLREARAALTEAEASTKGAWFDEAIEQILDSDV